MTRTHSEIFTSAVGLLFALLLCACGAPADSATEEPIPAGTNGQSSADGSHAAFPTERYGTLLEPFTGDWDEILESRVIRVLVVANRTTYFLDSGRARGITADALAEWEKQLNRELQLGSRPMRIAAIPVTREKLIPYLVEGRAEIAIAHLTVTPQRAEQVDFTIPTYRDVSEVVVTSEGGPRVEKLTDLSGLEVHVRRSSSYFESLQRVNEMLREQGLAPVEISEVPEYLETEDLLEMVNADLIEVTVADDFLAELWGQVYENLVWSRDVAIATGREGAWAMRKGMPVFKQRVDEFLRKNRQGTLIGNTLINRYFTTIDYVHEAADRASRERFLELLDLFEKYGEQYGYDPLMLAAQGYQESGLDQSRRSGAGAIGIMQVLPSTAADKAVGIENIEVLENNIHAGTKYLYHVEKTYFDDPAIDELNTTLFAFAGYNAGPNRINRLRQEAASAGYDPNKWFDNVEILVAHKVGREPVTYVSNIVKYYVAYSEILEQERERGQFREQ